jgi:hypothetical protein
MSAAANAAGYLYAHGQLPVSDLDAKAEAARPDRTANRTPEPVEQRRAPKIEYRRRRSYAVPSAALGARSAPHSPMHRAPRLEIL